MAADTADIRYVRVQNLWHLATDYFYFTGSKAGETVAQLCLNARSVAHFLTYADNEHVTEAITKAKASAGGASFVLAMFAQENEKEAFTTVLRALGNILDGEDCPYTAETSYNEATEALKAIIPADPDVAWSECSEDFYWIVNEWIDDVPILVEKKNGVWCWSLSRDRNGGAEATRDEAMRAGERALGWSVKPLKADA